MRLEGNNQAHGTKQYVGFVLAEIVFSFFFNKLLPYLEMTSRTDNFDFCELVNATEVWQVVYTRSFKKPVKHNPDGMSHKRRPGLMSRVKAVGRPPRIPHAEHLVIGA